jgi:hypothetical protein
VPKRAADLPHLIPKYIKHILISTTFKKNHQLQMSKKSNVSKRKSQEKITIKLIYI